MSPFGLKFSQMILHTETSKLMYNWSFLFEVLHKPTLLPSTFNDAFKVQFFQGFIFTLPCSSDFFKGETLLTMHKFKSMKEKTSCASIQFRTCSLYMLKYYDSTILTQNCNKSNTKFRPRRP